MLPHPGPGAWKGRWLKRIFYFIKEQNIEAFCYIDSDWDQMPMFQSQRIGNARLEDHTETKQLWMKEISDERYLKSSKDLFASLSS